MADPERGRGRIPWATLGVEATLVVLSVLLALALNSWRESYSEHQLAVRALQDLVAEATRNCSLVQTIHPYHEAVAQGQRDPEGIRIGMLTNDAWQSARSTGATAHIDYAVASVAGRVYSNQRDHRAIARSYADALFMALATGASLDDDLHGDLDVAAIREMVRIQERLRQSYGELQEAVHAAYEEVDADSICGEP